MRNICYVIDSLLAVIPGDNEMNDRLRKTLVENKNDALYTAPEAQWPFWYGVCKALNYWLPNPPTTDWQKDVLAIIKGEL